MQLLDVIHETHMVGAAKNDHTFRGRYSFENLVHTVNRKADVVIRHQKERRNVAAPLKRQLRWQNPRPRIRTSAGRKRHNRPDFTHYVRRGERCPATEAVADDSYRSEFELPFGQKMVEKKSNVGNAARDGGFGSCGPLSRSFAVSTSELGRDEFGVIQSRNDVLIEAGMLMRLGATAP